MRQNQHIILRDARIPSAARNVCRRPVCTENSDSHVVVMQSAEESL
jgi:hypothetical protein